MDSGNKVLIVGECHIDLYYKNTLFSDLIENSSKKIMDFYKNSDIKSKNDLKDILRETISDYHKKIQSSSFIKRGGNGNNSAELLVNLGIPVKLLTVIGSNASWMVSELQDLGIDVSSIYLLDKPTPISTIIDDPPITKILVAPNFKREMNFDNITISNEVFQGVKIIFFTPIAEKFRKIVHLVEKIEIISAFSIELQKVKLYSELKDLSKFKMDILFSNLKDLLEIFKKEIKDSNDIQAIKEMITEIDKDLHNHSYIRIYTFGRKGSFIRADNDISLDIPIVPVKVLDQTGAGDTFAAAFLAKLYSIVEDKNKLFTLYQQKNRENLLNILKECGEFSTYAAAYRLNSGKSPNKKELEKFMKNKELK